MSLFWLDWKNVICPLSGGRFSGGSMSANDLAVKYGTYQPENLLVILPLEEASDIIRESLRAEVRHELEYEYDDRISSAEEEASDWESRADSYECDAISFARAIEKALLAPTLDEAKIILERVRSDNREYF
ncbi:hypothetical protein R2U20_000462 [Enterobacter hormaechei]|nr:hypothetical protein [Enterobacter hormaechei]MBT1724615.1 hypothetical protein [Enterobacter hormaechei subsp. hoffmannii]ELQ3560530.1 hypothetical protein [Enterobacter hormaechei]MCL8113362.1 hypothetical protein [Enterobacter hormaechei]MCM8209488.1 hypothetical protein [Enterobacter hormaechei]OZP43410.1 hypothetical protein CIG28_10250 [Enterobacter hormaechei]